MFAYRLNHLRCFRSTMCQTPFESIRAARSNLFPSSLHPSYCFLQLTPFPVTPVTCRFVVVRAVERDLKSVATAHLSLFSRTLDVQLVTPIHLPVKSPANRYLGTSLRLFIVPLGKIINKYFSPTFTPPLLRTNLDNLSPTRVFQNHENNQQFTKIFWHQICSRERFYPA